jgi:transcriptional regulator with XRE-family HTH domain
MRGMVASSNAVNALVGQKIREVRENRRLSQHQLSELAGVSRTYLNQIENGSRNVGVVTLVMLSIALNTTPSDILDGFTKAVLRNLPEE